MSIQMVLIIAVILFIFIIVSNITMGFRLFQKYRLPYLFSYFIYTISWNIYGILGLVYLVFVPQCFSKNIFKIILPVNSLLFIPLYGLIAYFFLDFVVRLFGKQISSGLKTAFVFIFILLSAEFIIKVLPSISLSSYPKIQINMQYLLFFKYLCMYGSLIYLFLNLKNLSSLLMRKYFRIFSIIFVIELTLYIFIMMISHIGSLWESIFLCFIIFGFNIPPLLVLKRFLENYYASHPLEFTEKMDLGFLSDQCKISKRELEIVGLVIKGKSNNEIEEELFISLDTVKKHIYNIFKKTGVKNRLQLIYFIQNYNRER